MNTNFLQAALQLAEQAIGLSSPNPRVGCVIVKDDLIIGQGFTQAAGQAHAEVMAIRDAQARGCEIADSTVYVTLEPCSHYGRTPPCADTLIALKPKKVVVACLDPNPQVAGQGVEKLRAAGVEVEVLPAEHEYARAAYELNIGFMTRMQHHRPFTRMKWAQSADGKTALPNGRSQWITGDGARLDGHRFRARADAIVTGVGTILHDNPQMNVRGVEVVHQPIKYIIDTWAQTPINANVFADGQVCLVCAKLPETHVQAATLQARLSFLQQNHQNLVVLPLPTHAFIDADGVTHKRIDLKQLWQHFSEQSYNEIHVEAGATLNATLLENDLVDELLMYLAPRVVGTGLPTAQFADDVNLDDLSIKDTQKSGQWCWRSVDLIDSDLRLVLRKRTT